MIEFEILGKPTGKGRPRFRHVNNFVQTYTDKETASYENLVKLSYINSQCDRYFDEALIVIIDCYFSIPKSFSKKKSNEALEGKIYPQTKPDCDNIAKIILDALNGIAYNDDKQVVVLQITKKYGIEDKVVVNINKL